jgi:hypothetical protein
MNRTLFSTFAVFAAAFVLMGAGHEGGGGGEHGGGTVYRRKRVAVPQTQMPRAEHVVHDAGRAAYPEKNERGERISQRAAATPPAHHAAVVKNAGFVRNVSHLERTEVVPNHYYWHNQNGIRYSHYYDGHNHWYGFYHGPTFYWTRYYGNRWWWFDGPHARWVFWGNGYWWWAGPGGVAYVYMDNNYYPYESAGVVVEHQENAPASPASVPAPDAGVTTSSLDGRRMAQVFGSDAQAFLYDKSVTPPKFVKYLGQGVSKVLFSGGTAGAPVQIVVEYKDDTFALFDGDGNSQSAVVQSAETGTTPPPEPDSIPPAPTSAPGQ